MTDDTSLPGDPRDGHIAIKLRLDKDGQFFELPTGWKFTDNKVTFHKAQSALVLTPVRLGKLKLLQTARQAADYPKRSVN